MAVKKHYTQKGLDTAVQRAQDRYRRLEHERASAHVQAAEQAIIDQFLFDIESYLAEH